MPVPAVSPATGRPVPSSYLHTSSAHFQDTSGRSILLRGVNLSGGAKSPHGQPTHVLDGLWEEAEAGRGDFVGRPLNLEDGSADVHLARLRAWGFNMLRYVFTWEALEHEGPGKYDVEYIKYVVQVLKKCKEWGFRVFMDPHQDVWSRFSGGSGAPLWTLLACGIDPRAMSRTYAALIHAEYPSPTSPKPKEFPGMIWGTNYTRLVSQTVFTLFFGGREYAPKCIIDGINIQDWLTNHFVAACGALAKAISEEEGLLDECVIGWDSVNEPGEGFIGHPDLGKLNPELKLRKGPMPSPLEGLMLGVGKKVMVDDYYFGALGPTKGKKVELDPKGEVLWLSEKGEEERGGGRWGWKRDPRWKMGECIWALHGVWDPTTSRLLLPTYFATVPSTSLPPSFETDFWLPHFTSYLGIIRAYHPEAILFAQPPVFHKPPTIPPSLHKERIAASPHFYDGLTLMTKHWNWFNADALGLIRGKYWTVLQAVKVGDKAIRSMMQAELAIFRQDTKEGLGERPVLIGEIGCPYDMDDKRAYGYTDGGKGEGDYSMQIRAWDASMNAMDGANALNFTLWTYVPDNSHEWGDQWNGEDLSLWSADDLPPISSSASASPVSRTPNSTSLASSSIASSTTLYSPSSLSVSPKSISSGTFPASLLLDGARAVEAVCRPYPIATVGVPENIEFDIYTSAFKLDVRVGSQDAVKGMEGGKAVTEVYLPFVHYAAALPDKDKDTDGAALEAGGESVAGSTATLANPDSTTTSSSVTSTSTSTSTLELLVDIKVTSGTTSIQGQTLLWTYDVPATPTTLTLKVQRKGGALKRTQMQLLAGGSKGGGGGTWGDVCPSCVIA